MAPKNNGKSRAKHSQRMHTQSTFAALVKDLEPKQFYSDPVWGMCQSVPKDQAKAAAPVVRAMGMTPCEMGCMGNGECIQDVVIAADFDQLFNSVF